MCVYIYIYIYIYTHTTPCAPMCAPACALVPTCVLLHTVSFHNFKSQKFKLSVSNPKSKYVACLSVLSQISNCQSLGRKSKYEILKTDRNTKAYLRRARVRAYDDRA